MKLLTTINAAAVLAMSIGSSGACAAAGEREPDLPRAISHLLATDPSDPIHGVAYEDYEAERYHHSITVNFTGKTGDSVQRQLATTAEVALRIGYLVIQDDLKPPGPDLIIKMALKKSNGWFINTFSVRYRWADVIAATKTDAKIADLSAKGKIEQIWLEYWPTMCLNPPPRELFAGGDGDPEAPEDVENPKGKDLSCHRKR
jgi:hypothetical protein